MPSMPSAKQRAANKQPELPNVAPAVTGDIFCMPDVMELKRRFGLFPNEARPALQMALQLASVHLWAKVYRGGVQNQNSDPEGWKPIENLALKTFQAAWDHAGWLVLMHNFVELEKDNDIQEAISKLRKTQRDEAAS